jgi:hypothetical protein
MMDTIKSPTKHSYETPVTPPTADIVHVPGGDPLDDEVTVAEPGQPVEVTAAAPEMTEEMREALRQFAEARQKLARRFANGQLSTAEYRQLHPTLRLAYRQRHGAPKSPDERRAANKKAQKTRAKNKAARKARKIARSR